MVAPAKPNDLERFGVVGMMRVDVIGRAAILAGLPLEAAGEDGMPDDLMGASPLGKLELPEALTGEELALLHS